MWRSCWLWECGSSVTRARRVPPAVAKRRAFAIRGYVGANGHGKSMCAVQDFIPSLRAGRPILSNIRLLDFDNPRPCDDPGCRAENHATHMAAHPGFVALTDFSQLLSWSHGDVLLDEITGVASSRESSALPTQVVNLLVQLRRRDVTLAWTAPAWARADKVLREVSQLVVHCKGYASKERPSDDETRVWKDRRLFFFRGYDANVFEDFTAGKREKLKADSMQLFWRPKSVTERAYDTLDSVTGLGWAMESGLCIACGGRRSVPRCSCTDARSSAGPRPSGTAPRSALATTGEDLAAAVRPHRPSRAERREMTLSGVDCLDGDH